jgi:hypothetical protein
MERKVTFGEPRLCARVHKLRAVLRPLMPLLAFVRRHAVDWPLP